MTNQEAKEYLVKEGYAATEGEAQPIITDILDTLSYTDYRGISISEEVYNLIKG